MKYRSTENWNSHGMTERDKNKDNAMVEREH
jgi:hypothetical protein